MCLQHQRMQQEDPRKTPDNNTTGQDTLTGTAPGSVCSNRALRVHFERVCLSWKFSALSRMTSAWHL